MQTQPRAQRQEVRRLRAERDAAKDDVIAYGEIGDDAAAERAEAKRDYERLNAEVEQAEARIDEQEAGGNE
jgi:hypothetical protein